MKGFLYFTHRIFGDAGLQGRSFTAESKAISVKRRQADMKTTFPPKNKPRFALETVLM